MRADATAVAVHYWASRQNDQWSGRSECSGHYLFRERQESGLMTHLGESLRYRSSRFPLVFAAWTDHRDVDDAATTRRTHTAASSRMAKRLSYWILSEPEKYPFSPLHGKVNF